MAIEPREEELHTPDTSTTEQGEPARDPEKVVVGLNDEPPDVGPPALETSEDRRSRRQQHRELKEQLKARDEAYGKLERELADLRRDVQARPAQQQYVPQPVYQQQREDPVETEIAGLNEQQQAINMAIANPRLDEARVQRLTEQWNKLERQKQEMIVDRQLRRSGAYQNSTAPDGFQLQVAMLQAQYPEVYSSEVNRKAADLEYSRMLAAGKPATFTTAVEAAQRVRDQTTNRRPAPSSADRGRYTSVSARASGGATNGTFSPSKQQLINAKAMYDHLNIPDDDKVRLWLRNVGIKEGLVKNGA